MKRRDFIKQVAGATAATVAMPYLLPSGRLFAQTNGRLANHVILVLFAGGIRHQEAIDQLYLAGSQNEDIPGNVLLNMFPGEVPADKIVFGLDANRPGEKPITPVLSQPLSQQGTLFAEMRTSLVAHYAGLNIALQGTDQLNQGLRERPHFPTVFEYLRRHAGLPASKVWFIGQGINNSVPLLNASTHPDYGSAYGANFFAPTITFGGEAHEFLSRSRVYHPEFELSPVHQMKFFLDNSFPHAADHVSGLGNTEEEKQEIRQFIQDTMDKTRTHTQVKPPVSDNTDLEVVGYACEVLKTFKPNLTVLNFNEADTCHGNFTDYLRNLHRADHGLGFLWDYIQREIPEMAGDTMLLVAPECGRNLQPNPILDVNNWYGYDHNDENAHRIFGMMVGPNVPQGLTIGSPQNPVGHAMDLVPTVAEILGVKNAVRTQGLLGSGARSWFDYL